MVTALESSDSSRNFNMPTQSPWKQNAASGLTRAQRRARVRPKGKEDRQWKEHCKLDTRMHLEMWLAAQNWTSFSAEFLQVHTENRLVWTFNWTRNSTISHQWKWGHGDGFHVVFFWGEIFKILFWSEISDWKVLPYLYRFSYTFHLMYFWCIFKGWLEEV